MKWTRAADWLALGLGLALGAAFFYAGVTKRFAPYDFAEAVMAYQLLPQPLVGLTAAILPWVELISGFFLALGNLAEMLGRFLRALGVAAGERLMGGIKRRSCLLLIILELLIFLAVLGITFARGLKIDCGCGLLWAREVGWGIILEDLAMLAVAVWLYWWHLPAPPVIDAFEGDFAFLSNFAPAVVSLNGEDYPTVEHAYQAGKTLTPGERRKIREARTPGQARKLGRQLPLRPDWAEVKLALMADLVRQKFTRHQELQERLLATGDAVLVEGNLWHDNFWGDCRCPRCRRLPGENHLGRLLMAIREELRRQG